MKKLSSTLPNMVMSLGIITVVSAILLAFVHEITAGPVAAAARQKQIEAIKAVIPPFDNDPVSSVWDWHSDKGMNPLRVFPAYSGDRFIGAAVESYSLEGFSGEIKIMYGFDSVGVVSGYEVLQHAETPGLGARMNEWFRMAQGHRSVIGCNPSVTAMYVTKDPEGTVDAITAATITSRAFLEALRNAHEAFDAYRQSCMQSMSNSSHGNE